MMKFYPDIFLTHTSVALLVWGLSGIIYTLTIHSIPPPISHILSPVITLVACGLTIVGALWPSVTLLVVALALLLGLMASTVILLMVILFPLPPSFDSVCQTCTWLCGEYVCYSNKVNYKLHDA